MRQLLFLLVLFLLPLLSIAQSASRTASTTTTFGRHGNCSAGRGICGITINEDATDTQRAAIYSKIMSEHSFILTIARNTLLPEDEVRIAGKRFSEVKYGESLRFIQQEVLLVSQLSLQRLNLDRHTNKIYPGTYPMLLTKDTVEIQFTLEN